MKTVSEMIEVMQSYERGEQIEFCYNDEDIKVWQNTDGEPMWNWGDVDYRVKEEKTEFVPFDTAEEFLAAQRVHGIRIKMHNSVKISNTFVDCLGFIFVSTLNNVLDFKDVFEQYDFLDGTPCGKIVKTASFHVKA